MSSNTPPPDSGQRTSVPFSELAPQLVEKLRNDIAIFIVLEGLVVLGLVTLSGLITPEVRLPVGAVFVALPILYMAYSFFSKWGELRLELQRQQLEWQKQQSILPGQEPPPPLPRPSPKPERPEPAASTPDALRERYLALMPAEWRTLRLVGIDPEASDAAARRPMTLEQVYVNLDTRTPRPKEERRGKQQEEISSLPRDEPPLSALEVVCRAPEGRIVLLGLPGSGKSTFARHLALRLALACRNPAVFDFETYLPGWDKRVLLPVFVPLGRLAQSLPADATQGTAAMVETFIRDDVDQRGDLSGYGPHLLRELKAQGGLALFDGLDEVPAESRWSIKTAVTNFAALYDRCRVVVTCRTHSYRADPGWQLALPAVHELAPFSQEKIGQFTDAWYKTLSDIEPARAGDYARKADKLKGALSPADRRQLAELAQTPLLLTVMAVVHTDKDELPDSRVEVYKECVDILLLKWHAERTPGAGARSLLNELKEFDVSRASLYRALWEMAYEAHRAGDRQTFSGDAARAIVTEGTIRKTMHRYLGDDGLRAFIAYCQSANGLLLAQGVIRAADAPPDAPPLPVYTFPHLTFEEYLAARHLRHLQNFTGRAAELAGDPAWREVVLFLGEFLCFDEGGDIDHAQALLDKLCPDRLSTGDADWRRVWLAGELLPAVRSEAPAGELRADLDRRIVRRLIDLLSSPEALAEAPLDRAAAGRALAVLDDPRPGVGVKDGLPDIVWCEVAAGEFIMGDDAGDEEWGEKPAHPVTLAAFKISRYPITNAQFAAFVEDGGYQKEGYWKEAKAEGYWQTGKFKGRFDGEARDRPYDFGPPFNLANHPVVGVSWYEAVAFCRWLSDTQSVGGLARLPTEAEWEKAARGVAGAKYPWGNAEEAARRCNMTETGIGATSAVGIFPNGASPYEACDMSGNVWEWCSTVWDKEAYPFQVKEEWTEDYLAKTGGRVLRGGAFNGETTSVRCASRGGYGPYGRSGGGGFRVVLPPSP